MFVYCRDCNWGQDDFYDKDYNPAKFLAGYNEELFGKKAETLDEVIYCEEYVDEKPLYPDMTRREHIAKHYEEFAKRIREMKWTTYEAFKADTDKKCPKCGSDNLGID